jgi:hypothetical protein
MLTNTLSPSAAVLRRLASFLLLALAALLCDQAAAQTNLALGKPATQTSTCFDSPASRAVDGNTNGNWAANSVTHTCLQGQPSWQVDLGAEFLISQIEIYNRTDCCGARLANFDVTVLTLAGQATWASYQASPPSPGLALAVPGARGRVIRVQLRGTGYLAMAEVRVFGSPAPIAPIGYLDAADAANDGRIKGWAFDPEVPSTSIDVHIYFDAGTPQVRTYAVPANVYRPDVNSAYRKPRLRLRDPRRRARRLPPPG